jgi:hypothetical protein
MSAESLVPDFSSGEVLKPAGDKRLNSSSPS